MQQTITPDDAPTSQSHIQISNDILTQQQLQLLSRVMELSFQQSLKKPQKVNGLPIEFRKMITNLKMKKSKQTCTICLSGFVEEGQIIKQLPCKHILHRQCAKSWLKVNKNCPICRLNLEEHYRKQKMNGKIESKPLKNKIPEKKENEVEKQIQLYT